MERFGFACRHQFAWPRRAEGGDYYQVCVQCGVKYRYDWRAMRRTQRIEQENLAEPAAPKKPVRKCVGRSSLSATPASGVSTELKRTGWRPRERRLHFEALVLYRAKDAATWGQGWSENISRSGLLFRAETELATGTALELILDMPTEITGVDGAKVLCQATVARLVPGAPKHSVSLAVTIDGYEFLPQEQAAG